MAKCFCISAGSCIWHNAVTNAEEWVKCSNGVAPKSISDRPVCVYLGRVTSDPKKYQCWIHGTCVLQRGKRRPGCAVCAGCKQYTPLDKARKGEFVDPLRITDRRRKKTDALRDMLNGRPSFLVCGGPSLKKMPYERLAERGVFSMGVNNVAGYAPVSAFVCSDPPEKFHTGIFQDPNIMKFLPLPKLKKNRGQLRKKIDGVFEDATYTTDECPNTWGFERRSWLMPDDSWFTEPSAAWGNHKDGVERTGQPKTVMTMLLGIRLLQYLGSKDVFLLGVDFYMDPTKGPGDNYAFKEIRTSNAVGSNNNQFKTVSKWLEQLRPVFESWGYRVYNCNPESHLRAFDYVPFETALKACKGDVPEEPFDLVGWYVKDKKEDD